MDHLAGGEGSLTQRSRQHVGECFVESRLLHLGQEVGRSPRSRGFQAAGTSAMVVNSGAQEAILPKVYYFDDVLTASWYMLFHQFLIWTLKEG